MAVDSKHIATFLLGAASALAAYKYVNMTPDEKDKLAADLKDKANKIKGEAENAMEKGKEYFEELKTKGADAMKEHFGDVGSMLHNFFNSSTAQPTNTDSSTTK